MLKNTQICSTYNNLMNYVVDIDVNWIQKLDFNFFPAKLNTSPVREFFVVFLYKQTTIYHTEIYFLVHATSILKKRMARFYCTYKST